MRISALLAFLYPDIAIADPVHLYTLDKTSIGNASNTTIQATLDATQIEAVGLAPMLYMMEGAVQDMSGNPIGEVRGLDVDRPGRHTHPIPPRQIWYHHTTIRERASST